MAENLILEMKQGDTAPRFRAQLLDGDDPVDLTTASQVKLLIGYTDGTALSQTVTVENQTTNTGWVNRTWVAGETELAGNHQLEVEVLWADGTRQTFPRDTYGEFIIIGDLG